MLGLNKTKKMWNWAACGKHPTAGDYFQVGSDLPLFKALSTWVENGFGKLNSSSVNSVRSWRFWAKSHEKDSFVFGVVRDSSDSHGRPYPFLVMGSGRLKGFKKYWDTLSYACERSWSLMEQVCTKRYDDIRKMEEALVDIIPPEWKEPAENGGGIDGTSVHDIDEIRKELAGLTGEKEAFIPLNGRSHDPKTGAALLHSLLKSSLNDLPNAVFMGGLPEKPCVAVFNRPLQTTDFVKLWSLY